MTSKRFTWACSLVLTLSTSAACGGHLADEQRSPVDGGIVESGGGDAPIVEAGPGPHPTPKHCPAGFVLEGDVCAAWVEAGSTGCDSTATRLNDGRVLCPGAEDTLLYDPVSGNWSKASGLHTARVEHTATLLANGQVLIVGGVATDGTTLASAEIFDPESASWHDVAPMTMPRRDCAATLLSDGRVLVVGGAQGDWPDETALSSTEIFDPATQKWTQAAEMSGPRIAPHAVPMKDGAILVFGGGHWLPTQAGLIWQSTAETFDTTAGVWQPAPSLPGDSLLFGFSAGTATVLEDGSVIGIGLPGVASGAAILDPARTNWQPTATAPVAEPLTSLLPNGKVLVVSTDIYAVGPSRASVYDPTHDTWTMTQSPSGKYYGGTTTQLLDGSVLALRADGAERYVLEPPIDL